MTMSYGRILLVAALVFGGLYYYHTNELERQEKAHYNQLERDREAREAVSASTKRNGSAKSWSVS